MRIETAEGVVHLVGEETLLFLKIRVDLDTHRWLLPIYQCIGLALF
jgi:hypothetical protein